MIDIEKQLNPEVVALKPSGIRKYFDIAATMDDVITLGVGEPDFKTPWHIREAGIKSLEKGYTRYTSNHGMIELRRAVSKFMQDKYDLNYCADNQILITVGGSEAIDGCIRALISPGDEVLVVEPSFVCYSPIVKLAGGVPVIIETKNENSFRLTADELRSAITDKTKMLILII